MIRPFTNGLASEVRQHLNREDFEEVGIRVAERRFSRKDVILATGALLQDGGVFGELSLEEGGAQSVFAEAFTETWVAKVRKSALTEVMGRNPELATKLFFSFSERLRQSEEVIDSLLEREVSARLATLLANLGNRFGETNGSATVLNVRLTHQDLANMIVSTREAVSKVMSEFQREGLIEVRDRRIAIKPLLGRTSPGATMRN